MRLLNYSRYPTGEVRPLLRCAMRGVDGRGIIVKVEDAPSDPLTGRAAGWSGLAHPADDQGRGLPWMLIRAGSPDGFPKASVVAPYARMEPLYLEDWREAFVFWAALAAGEVRQLRRGARLSGAGCARWASRRLAAWRESEGRGPSREAWLRWVHNREQTETTLSQVLVETGEGLAAARMAAGR